MLLTAVNQGRLTLPDLVQKMSTRAAEVFHLDRKGQLAPGYDADVTLVDMSARWTFDMYSCFSKSGESMDTAHGKEMHGKVNCSIVRGVPVYRNGAIVAQPGHGQWLKR